jgi:dipeptidase
MAISVTPSAANQSAIASNDAVNEANVRVRFCRPRPPGAGVRTHATTSSFPMSIPAQRSTSTSTSDLLTTASLEGGAGGANRSTTL